MAPRVWLKSALTVAVTGVLLAGVFTTPAQAEPSPKPSPSATPTTLKDAKDQVVALETEASALEEDLEEAKLALEDGKRRLRGLLADIAAQQAKVDELSEQARVIALMQFQGRGIDTTVQLFTETDPDAFLDRLTTTSNVDATLNGRLSRPRRWSPGCPSTSAASSPPATAPGSPSTSPRPAMPARRSRR